MMQALSAAPMDMYSTVILSLVSAHHKLQISMQQEDVWLVRLIHFGIIKLFNVLLVSAQLFIIQLSNHVLALKNFLTLTRKENALPAQPLISGTVRLINVLLVQTIFSMIISSDVVHALKHCQICFTTIPVFLAKKEAIGIPIIENV